MFSPAALPRHPPALDGSSARVRLARRRCPPVPSASIRSAPSASASGGPCRPRLPNLWSTWIAPRRPPTQSPRSSLFRRSIATPARNDSPRRTHDEATGACPAWLWPRPGHFDPSGEIARSSRRDHGRARGSCQVHRRRARTRDGAIAQRLPRHGRTTSVRFLIDARRCRADADGRSCRPATPRHSFSTSRARWDAYPMLAGNPVPRATASRRWLSGAPR